MAAWDVYPDWAIYNWDIKPSDNHSGHGEVLKHLGFDTMQKFDCVAKVWGKDILGKMQVNLTDTIYGIVGTKQLEGRKLVAVSFKGTDPKTKDSLLNATATPIYWDRKWKGDDGGAIFINNFDTIERSKKIASAQSQSLVHEGFASAAMSAWGYLYNKYPEHFKLENNKDTIYWINGHSLGGAIAELFALNLREQGVPSNHIICYGFGTPPVGNKTLAERAQKDLNMGDRIFKVKNEGDLVPFAGINSYTLASTVYPIHETDINNPIFYHLDGYKPRLKFEAWLYNHNLYPGAGATTVGGNP